MGDKERASGYNYDKDSGTLVKTTREEWINRETGEIAVFDNIQKRIYGQKNFWKCYLMDFLSILGVFDNKQVDIFIYIVENTNPSTNLFIGTYTKIAKDIGCSSATIAKIMKKLKENNFIKRVQNGVWAVNPNILMKGNENKRQMLLTYYEAEEPIDEITFRRSKGTGIDEDQIPGQITVDQIKGGNDDD